MIKIQPCKLDQVDELQKISVRTFTETFADQNEQNHLEAYLKQAYNINRLKREIENDDSYFYFAYVQDEIAGYLKVNVGAAQSESMGEETCELERIYVKQAFQKLGVGKRLYEKAIELACALDKHSIWLGVWEHNQNAISFYQRHGFIQTGSHSFYMGEDEQVDLIFTKTLKD